MKARAQLGATWFVTRLAGVAAANDDGAGATPARRALVHTGPATNPRERFAVALMSAASRASAAGDARATMAVEAAALLGRDTGADPRHTTRVLFIAANEAAAMVRRVSLDAAHAADPATLAEGGALDIMRAGLDALTIAVTALDAFAVENAGGAR